LGYGVGCERAAEQFDALAHASQPVAATGARGPAVAVVADLDADLRVVVGEDDAGGGARSGVFHGVGQGFLDDAVDRQVHGRGQGDG
jgi:hypothetical protein